MRFFPPRLIVTFLLCGACVQLLRAEALPPVLVRDINVNAATTGFQPVALCQLGSWTLFQAHDPQHGYELWRTDGTAAGTSLLLDIAPGTRSSFPGNFGVMGAKAYFLADDGVHGAELWSTDGTAAGTAMVADLYPGYTLAAGTYRPNSSQPGGFVVAGGIFYFSATSSQGRRLWKSDGTAAGTSIFSMNGRDPESIRVVGSTLFFVAFDGSNQMLWQSQGTTTTTKVVRNSQGRSFKMDVSSSTRMAVVGQTLFFGADDGVSGRELWKTDGTTAGTLMVKDINPGSSWSGIDQMLSWNGALYFFASTPTFSGLWRSDGTEAGTIPLSAGHLIYPVAAPSAFYFMRHGGNNAYALWKSDGTTTGTREVKAIYPGGALAYASEHTLIGDLVYFSGNDGVHGNELWVSDGSTDGTQMVLDINPGSGQSFTRYILPHGDGALFVANDGVSTQLWKSDGTAPGTVRVTDASHMNAASYPSRFVGYENTTYFFASDASLNRMPWSTDGTAAGTRQLYNLLGNERVNFNDSGFIPLKGDLYFTGGTEAAGVGLWKVDPSRSSVSLVRQISAFSVSATASLLTRVGDKLFFVANDLTHGSELWSSDGTDAGTAMVKDIRPGSSGAGPTSLIELDGKLFFYADDDSAGLELWISDGTETGTRMVKDINPNPRASSWSPSGFVTMGGRLYFGADDGTRGHELWSSDGTDTGTFLVADIATGSGFARNSLPTQLTAVNDTVFFVADDGLNGKELWKTDGTSTGTTLVKDVFPGASTSNPSYLIAFRDVLYFVADDGVHGPELWRSDGTAAGTTMLKDIFPGSSSSMPYLQAISPKALYFAASNGTHGHELWKTDGSADGTVMVADLTGDSSSSNPGNLALAGGGLYFSATTYPSNTELWMLPLAAPGAITGDVTDIGTTEATLQGTVNPQGLESSAYFEYGLSESLGSRAVIPGAGALRGSSAIHLSVTLQGLIPGATYHYRMVGASEAWGYGEIRTFTTISNDSRLADLSFPEWLMTPAFSAEQASYVLAVAHSATSVSLTAAATNQFASMKVRVSGGNYITITPGSASPALALDSGSDTLIELLVTAQDGSTRLYSVTARRQNIPPKVIGPGIPDQVLTLGLAPISLNLLAHFTDVDVDDHFGFSVVGNTSPGKVTASVAGDRLALAPVALGESTITIRCVDDGVPAYGVTTSFKVSVGTRFPTIDGVAAPILNRVTGMQQVSMTIRNTMERPLEGVRVRLLNARAPYKIRNTTHPTLPVVDVVQVVPAGESVSLTIEFYDPGSWLARIPPRYGVTELLGVNQGVGTGEGVRPLNITLLPDDSYALRFRTVPGRRYHLDYSDDGITWRVSPVGVRSGARFVHWIDYGQPATQTRPATPPKREYRLRPVR